MKLPYSWNAGNLPLQLTTCEDDGFGNTLVRGTVYGVSFKPFLLKGVVVGDQTGQAGFDDVRTRIEGTIARQICEAMPIYTGMKDEV
jgi:hypothetical protein